MANSFDDGLTQYSDGKVSIFCRYAHRRFDAQHLLCETAIKHYYNIKSTFCQGQTAFACICILLLSMPLATLVDLAVLITHFHPCVPHKLESGRAYGILRREEGCIARGANIRNESGGRKRRLDRKALWREERKCSLGDRPKENRQRLILEKMQIFDMLS